MKLGNDPNIIRRLLKYGRTLFKDYKKYIIVLSLINNKNEEITEENKSKDIDFYIL